MLEELDKHIHKSFERLSSEDYSIKKIWKNQEYDWPGDWEGRALLAFVCLYEITGEKIPCMDQLLDELPQHLNSKGYLGEALEYVADEQQISGHSWLLRGLIEYYNVFHNEKALHFASRIVENLYLPLIDLYEQYPTKREKKAEGGVSGKRGEIVNGWILSSDVGCAYMCLDGLSAYYAAMKDGKVRKMIDGLLERFTHIDRLKMKCQTHATLSATRGIVRMYRATGEKKYLDIALSIYDFYLRYGMTLTYENFNWFDRKDTWTEPCAVVDSFILAAWFYEITKEPKYQTLASRIYFNGLRFCHRDNGGAGPNTCVYENQQYLNISMYEADFCCTMRYCEGLKFVKEYEDIIVSDEEIRTDEKGRVFYGNKLLLVDENGDFPGERKIKFNGRNYIEIPSFVKNGKYRLMVFEQR